MDSSFFGIAKASEIYDAVTDSNVTGANIGASFSINAYLTHFIAIPVSRKDLSTGGTIYGSDHVAKLLTIDGKPKVASQTLV